MTKKHFTKIAEIIREQHELEMEGSSARAITREVLGQFANNLAKYLKSENSAFDKGRFLEACKL
jgi:hypothetical protein